MHYGMKVTDIYGKAFGGFQWPLTAGVRVTCPDWSPEAVCGQGLHFWLNGCGDADGPGVNWDIPHKWYVIGAEQIVELVGKVKAPEVEVLGVYNTAADASHHLQSIVGAQPFIFGTSTSGYRGTSTSGYRGTSTSGDGGTSTSGYRGTSTSGHGGTSTSGHGGTSTSGHGGTSTSGHGGTSTSGDGGTSTSGNGGTSTSGNGGIIQIMFYSGRRRIATAYVGEDGIKPNTPYRLDDQHNFVEVK